MSTKKRIGGKFKHDLTFMRQVVAHYQDSEEGYGLTGKRFGVSASQVKNWVLRFSSDLGPISAVVTMTPSEQQELDAIKKQKEELEKQLELAKMQIFGLQTLIDVAEDTLKIDIRKKPGTKQSKK